MVPLSRETFVDTLEAVDPTAVANFVAALERARDHSVRVEEDPPAVVVDGEHNPVTDIDPEEYYDLAYYAVDRKTCDRAFRDHLGREGLVDRGAPGAADPSSGYSPSFTTGPGMSDTRVDGRPGPAGERSDVDVNVDADADDRSAHRGVGEGGDVRADPVDAADADTGNEPTVDSPQDRRTEPTSVGADGWWATGAPRPRGSEEENGDGDEGPKMEVGIAGQRSVVLGAGVVVAVVAVVATVLGGAGAGTGMGFGSDDGVDDDLAGETTGVVDVGATVGRAGEDFDTYAVIDGPASRVDVTGAGDDASGTNYPPGLGPDGIESANALAGSHAEAVSGRPYVLTVTYREFVDGNATAVARERVVVANRTTYRAAVTRTGKFRGDTRYVEDESAYADGRTRYERGDDGIRTSASRVRAGDEGRYADRVETYVEWSLSKRESVVADTVVRNGSRYYFVVAADDPWPGIENATASALVDRRGVVHELHSRYDEPDSPVSASMTVEYEFGPTTVDPPVWLDAGSGTNATTTEP